MTHDFPTDSPPAGARPHERSTLALRRGGAAGEARRFSRSLAVSLGLHGAALGCALLLAGGTAGGPPAARVQDARLVMLEPETERARPDPPEPARELESPDPAEPELREAPAETAPALREPLPRLEPMAHPDRLLAQLVRPLPPLASAEPPAEEPAARTAPPAAAASTAPSTSPQAQRTSAAPVHTPPPSYPRASIRRGEEGSVLLRLTIDATGRVECAEVLESSGSGRLDRAALDAVLTWRFRPATLAGLAVATTLQHEVVFQLE